MKAIKAKEGRAQPRRRTIPTFTDPYLPWGGSRETLVCRICHSVYYHKRWYAEGATLPAEAQKTPTSVVICPACRKIQNHYPGGIITLRGSFLVAHKDEILHLVRNEEDRAREVNPLERIISIKDRGNFVEIHTTSERFAQRLGREIERAYKGDATYHWSEDDKFVRVEWTREEKKE